MGELRLMDVLYLLDFETTIVLKTGSCHIYSFLNRSFVPRLSYSNYEVLDSYRRFAEMSMQFRNSRNVFSHLSLDNSVDIARSYGLEDQCCIHGRGKRFFSTPQRPVRLWGPPSLLSNG
jgi:hypothetical protein